MRAGDGELAAHELGEFTGEGKAEAGAAVFLGGGGFGLGEGLEKAAELFGGHADAGVGNFKFNI